MRASWKGHLTIDALSCAIGFYPAVSASSRLSFHIINRKTGHRVERRFMDSETGKVVDRADQVKGYRLDDGQYIVLDGDDIASVIPEADKTLTIERFTSTADVDTLYLDKPYYLAAVDETDEEVLSLIKTVMAKRDVVALAHAVMFRRYRTILIRSDGENLIANMLNFDYEVRSAKQAFKNIPAVKTSGEMLELAQHIIDTKRGQFDPAAYEDRYEAAIVELVKAKIDGRPIPKRAKPKEKVVDLMEALRESAKLGKASKPSRKTSRSKSSGAQGGPERKKAS